MRKTRRQQLHLRFNNCCSSQWSECCRHHSPCSCDCVTQYDQGQGWCNFNQLYISRLLQELWHTASLSLIQECLSVLSVCVCNYIHVKLLKSKGSKFFKNLASIISTLLHNHTISNSYKLTHTQAQCAPTLVAQSLNFRDRMTWFRKQYAAYWQLCYGWGHYLGRATTQTGHNVGHICKNQPVASVWEQDTVRMSCERAVRSSSSFCLQSCCEGGAKCEGNRGWCLYVRVHVLVLLSAQCQDGVNGLSAITRPQPVYPNECNSTPGSSSAFAYWCW